jgi:GH24 family phage-related lysozyme (muramidase)
MAALGYTGQEAIDQMDKQLAAQGVGLPQRLQMGMTHGLDIGVLPKSFGETIAQSVRAVAASTDKAPVSEDLVESLNGVVSTLTLAEQKNPGARGVLLSAMPKDTQAQMAYILTQQDKGVAPTQAIKEYATAKEDFAKLDNLQAGMQTNKFKTTVQERIDSEVSSGFFGRIGNALTGNSNLSTNPLHAAQLGAALQDEVSSITSDRNNMGLSPEAALEMAVANVQARTIQVGERGWAGTGEARRSLIMPRGVDLQTVFQSNDKQLIGRMLSQMHPADASGYESSFQYNRSTGVLENIQVSADGVVARRTPVDAPEIGRRIRADNERVFAEAEAAHFGAPVEVAGTAFRIDGGNTYGIPVRAAYNFRKELAGFESYRDTVYKDRNGLAVGIGHNVTGQMKEGDKISKAQAEQWFREDTDNAMQVGSQLAGQLGVRDGRAKAALAGAVFQLGAAGFDDHQRTADAIAKVDWNSFVKEVRSSKWAEQTPNRAEWFIKNMAPHFAR